MDDLLLHYYCEAARIMEEQGMSQVDREVRGGWEPGVNKGLKAEEGG